MGKIVKFNSKNKELHTVAKEIRKTVFVEEQNVPIEIEWEYEEESVHFLIYKNKKAVGTARYRMYGDKIKFERFAILQEGRSKGYGRDILRYMLTDVKMMRKAIILNAQITAVEFYKRSGFIVSGEKFMEADIVHYPMVYEEPKILEKALEKAICRR